MQQGKDGKKMVWSRVVAIALGLFGLAVLLAIVARVKLEERLNPAYGSAKKPSVLWVDKLLSGRSAKKDRPRPGMVGTMPEPRIFRPVEWPASSTIDWELRNQLPQELVEKIDQSPVPVLLPGDVEMARNITFYPREDSYLADIDNLGFNFSVGKTNFDPVGAKAKGIITHTIRGNPGRISVHADKGTIYFTWIENNVLYDLQMPCGGAGCADKSSEASMVKLVNNLKYVGGAKWNDGK
jgi:hypothetical protein